MKIEKLLLNVLMTTLLTLNSGFVWAVSDQEADSPTYWPVLVLLALLFVFRKKLIAEATAEPQDASHDAAGHEHESVVTQKKPAVSQNAAGQSGLTDLTQNVEQCQGTTAKGSRCSRTANLEPIIVKIEKKQYKFLSCKQHSNDNFTPFHFR